MSQVLHNKEGHKFTVACGGTESVLEYRELNSETLEYYRTYVPEECRRQGLAQLLAKEALEFAKSTNKKVKPTCWFVDKFMTKPVDFL